MGRAVRNTGFAVRLWELQSNAFQDVCRDPVLRFVKQCISQGNLWAAFLRPPMWHLVQSYEHNALNVKRSLEDWFPLVRCSPR